LTRTLTTYWLHAPDRPKITHMQPLTCMCTTRETPVHYSSNSLLVNLLMTRLSLTRSGPRVAGFGRGGSHSFFFFTWFVLTQLGKKREEHQDVLYNCITGQRKSKPTYLNLTDTHACIASDERGQVGPNATTAPRILGSLDLLKNIHDCCFTVVP
jgi:hypothetical protein